MLFVQLLKPLCIQLLQSGFIHIEIFHFYSTNGPQLSDGNSSIQLHSLEQENSCGRKDIQHMQHGKKVRNSNRQFWTFTPRLMKSYLLVQLFAEENHKMNALLVLTILPLLNCTFQFLEEVSKVPLLIVLVKTFPKCLMFGMKTIKSKNNLCGKLHGDFLQDLLEV